MLAGKPLGEIFHKPQLHFEAKVGVKKTTLDGIAKGDLDDSMDTDEKQPMRLRPSSYLVGQQLEDTLLAGEPIEISYPWRDGRIHDWIGAEALWKHALKQLLGNPRAATALVLVTVPHGLSKDESEKITQIFFERFNVPVFALLERPVLGLYASGSVNGLFIDIGYDSTDVVPVLETMPQYTAATHWRFGTRELSVYLASLLKSDSHLLAHEKLSALGEQEKFNALVEIAQELFNHPHSLSLLPEEDEKEKKKGEELDIAAALVSGQEQNLIDEKDAKENNPAASQGRFEVQWRGSTVSVGKIRQRFWEPLFNMNLLKGLKGVDEEQTRVSLPEAIVYTLDQCEIETRQQILNGLVLAGPLAGSKGFSQLLAPHIEPYLSKGDNNELQASASAIKVLKVPDYFADFKKRDDLNTFLGASIVAKITSADHSSFAITKADYNLRGPAVITVTPYLVTRRTVKKLNIENKSRTSRDRTNRSVPVSLCRRHQWKYLSPEQSAASPQSIEDKYWLGLDINLPQLPEPRNPLDAARNGFKFYKQIQSVDGHWAGEYGGPMFLLPGLVISNYISGVKLAEEQRVEIIRYLFNRAHEVDGGWGIHIESPSTVFGTALNYTALRLLGVEADHPVMTKARGTLHKLGGATGSPAWGKFWLACLGVYDWDGVNPVPPELWLLPDWLPIHPTKWWIHCRQIYLPMSYLYGKRFIGRSTELTEQLKQELYVDPYASIDWSAQRNNVNKIDLFQPHSAVMDALNAALYYGYEPCSIPPLRQAALRKAYTHIVHEDENTCYQGLAPINKAFNQLCRLDADGPDSNAVKKHLEKTNDFLWLGPDGLRETGTNGSQLWDAAFIAQALVETGLGEEEENKQATEKLLEWIDKCQIRQDPLYPAYRQPTKGAWPFSTAEQGYTVSDCTAEGIKSVIYLQEYLKHTKHHVSYERLHDSVDLLLGMQNADGGFASYELTRGSKHLELLNPAEVFGKIMVEYSYPECTTSVVTALSLFKKHQPDYRREDIERTTNAAIKYIHAAQREDGSWYGSWAICFTYAAMFALESLSSVGEHYENSEKVRKACEFLLSKQKEDGGWGESYLSCETEEYTQHQDSQVVQTSWVVLALLHARYPHKEPIKRAVRLIMSRQNKDGSWTQEAIEGIFNKNCAISYPNYKFSFTIWALGKAYREVGDIECLGAAHSPKPLPLGYESPKDKAYRKLVEQPLVPIGIGATIIALTRAAMEIRRGNSRAANKFFRYRVYAQGATVVAAVGGMWYYGTAQEQKGARIERDRLARTAEFEKRLDDLNQAGVGEQAMTSFRKHASEADKRKVSTIADLDLTGTSWDKLPAETAPASEKTPEKTQQVNTSNPPMPTSGRFSQKDPLASNRGALRCGRGGVLAVASNNQIAVIDGTKVLKSTEGHTMPIRVLLFSSDDKQLISTGDDKQLNVWNIEKDALVLKDTVLISKRANSLNLLNEDTVLVGDKFGDIFTYKLNRTDQDKENDAKTKNKDKEPLLGHVSMVNDVAVTPSHIISADRDAHIRISRNPLGYVIDMFCLGHEKFITAVGVLDENLLLSGGGDDYMILWNYKEGKEMRRFDVRDAVLAHASVRAIKIQDKMLKSDDIPADYGEHILCIDRILVSGIGKDAGGDAVDPLVLFTSCGATGVFYARKSAFVEANEFNIQAVDLQHPIIEMADMGGGKFVVTLDTSRGAPDAAAVLMLNSEGELQISEQNSLVSTLNGLTVQGAEKDVKHLDLYSQLALQPKVEGEDNLDEEKEHPEKSGRTGEKRRAREAAKMSNQAKKSKTDEST
ncbi:hypothetical protein E3P81_03998 [Wallemia ichthyophaga]|nr:hypothetical protein E3P97_04007 [Wallemia ichthyophaga]TIB43430.1 hypothetical protein E3P82_04006 [Wallemia ichthyophaga]TIB45577.1 hypothetical protein E3P81_03998 [Wallemia ichthyophaga]TIB47577.1 hypothetical protein E3P80_04010 [Wallemia ichthyophaga]TIB55084.1 hypothetical protein E3P79_04001 [Wallemia ichthyophaga]